MKMRILTVVAAVALLGACSSTEEAGKTGTGTGMTTGMNKVMVEPGSQGDLVANYGDKIFFDFDKSDLRPDARAQLAKWVDFLKKYPNKQLLIEGNCDERGTQEYNLALGDRRANAAKSFLVAQGVSASRLKTISYGKEKPSVLGSNETAWAQNRNDHAVVQ